MTCRKEDKPSYGKRLLPQLLDELSQSTPERLYASYPYSVDISQGFRDVTFQDMSKAVDSFAWWIEKKFGRSQTFETLSYVGIPDLRTAIIFLACVKCGYKLLLLSQRNTVPTDVSLLQQTRCEKILFSSEMKPIIEGMQTSLKGLEYAEVLSLDEIFEVESSYYPYNETFHSAKRNPIVILHSSGSTGIPKPITMTHGTFATIDNDRNLYTVEGRRNGDATIWDFPGGGRFFAPFPPSHLAGFAATAVSPIYSEAASPVFGPALRPADGAMVKEIMQYQKLRGLYLPPAIVEQLLQEPGGVENFKDLDILCYAGGPLATAAGDTISKVTDICQIYGGTETGQIHQIFPSRDDWGYMEWHPSENLIMEYAEDDAYELVMNINPETEAISHLNHNFPDLDRYRTRDLFRPHPKKPHLWRFHGRTDDIIVLSNGEKFNPVPMEIIIQGHPSVSGALVIGQGRFQAALLVEGKPGLKDLAGLEKSLFSLVEQGNEQLPSQGRISRSKVMIVSPDKSFHRAGKGTVVRQLTERNLLTEIEALYKEKAPVLKQTMLKASYSLETIEEFVHTIVDGVFPGLEMDKSHNLFLVGLDSLRAMEITDLIRANLTGQAIAGDASWLKGKIIYRYPSISQLSVVLSDFLNTGIIPDPESHPGTGQRIQKMSTLVDNYTASLPQRSQRTTQPQQGRLSVAITGSTGSLGFHLLRRLLTSARISKIYCLNRAADAQEIIEEKLSKLSTTPNHCQPIYLTVRLGQERLGLTTAQYTDLADNVDVIIHNAWKVDFNMPLETYEYEHIRGTRHIIDLTTGSGRQPRIVFISSVSSAGNWANTHGTTTSVPETPLKEYEVASNMGYGESKNITEQILHIASQRCDARVSVLRLGQIAGSTDPQDPSWSEQEWIPSLIKTSKSLKMLPADLPDVDWIPVNLLADIMLEIIYSDYDSSNRETVYNLVNPRPIPWSSLLDTIRQHLGPQVEIAPLKDWLVALDQTQSNGGDRLSSKPALKLLDFFNDLTSREKVVRYDVQHSLDVSKSMARLEAVKSEWMKVWLEQWSF